MTKHHQLSKQQIEKFIVEKIYKKKYTKITSTGRNVHAASNQQIMRFIMEDILSTEYDKNYNLSGADNERIKDWYEKQS